MARQFRKRKRKRYGKRRKRYRRKRRRKLISMGTPSGLPVTRIANLRYVSYGSLQSTLGAMQQYVFAANGCFDPDVSGIGHQPMGYDQWAALYNHYVVVGAKITVRWGYPTSETIVCGCYLADDASTPYTTYPAMIEARKGSHTFIHHGSNRGFTSSKYSAKKFFNIANIKDNVLRLGSTISTNPGETANFILWAQSQDLSSTENISYIAVIDYIVLWSEPRDITQS